MQMHIVAAVLADHGVRILRGGAFRQHQRTF